MNSRKKAQAILQEVFELLDESFLNAKIVTPTEKAAESFQYDPKPVVTYPYFLKVTGSLVRHIYRQALGQKLSMAQACAETLVVLETGYRNAHHRGFDAAYLDAQNSQQDGLEQVLVNISDIIIETQREKHFRWVCTTLIDPSGWITRCRMVEAMQKQEASCFSEALCRCPAAQLADHLPELISAVISSNAMANKLTGADIETGLA